MGIPTRQPERRRRRDAGFTLMELLLALAISAVVMGAVPAVIAISAKAAPSDTGVQSASSEASDLFAQLNADLRLAKSVTAISATSITMTTVPRSGGAGTDTVTYAWGGTAGDPVTMQTNADPAVVLVSAADDFAINPIPVARTVYTQCDLLEKTGLTLQSASGTSAGLGIPAAGGLIQALATPTETDMIGWSINQLRLTLWSGAPQAGESIEISLIQVNKGIPTGVVLFTTSVASADVSSGWTTLDLPIAPVSLSATESVGVLLKATSSAINPFVTTTDTTGYTGGSMYAASADGGPWAAVAGRVLVHRFSGDALTSTGGAAARNALGRLDVSVTTGEDGWKYATSLFPLNPPTKP